MENVVLFVMNQKGQGVLEHLIATYGKDVIRFVVVPRPFECSAGDRFVEITDICTKNGIPFHTRDAYPPVEGYAFAVGWRWMLSDVPKLIITHDSLLPKYRGFAPLVNALVNGEKKVGVTIFIANGRYDEGEVLGQRSLDVTYPLKIQDAIAGIIPLYAGLITDVIDTIRTGTPLKGSKQDESKATYSLWLDEHDYRIDWTADAATLKRFIDAVGAPYDGACTVADGQTYRVLDAQTADDLVIERRHPGKIIFVEDGKPVVVCGTGLLKLTDIRHGDGSAALPWKKFRTRFV